jgi:hypothetical protein
MRSTTIKKALLVSIAIFVSGCSEISNKNEDDTPQSATSQVVIRGYESFPTAEGCESGGMSLKKNDCYLLPNGTIGEVVEWNKKYTAKGSVFAQMDMFAQSKVKITSGPAEGRTLYVAHAYISLI